MRTRAIPFAGAARAIERELERSGGGGDKCVRQVELHVGDGAAVARTPGIGFGDQKWHLSIVVIGVHAAQHGGVCDQSGRNNRPWPHCQRRLLRNPVQSGGQPFE